MIRHKLKKWFSRITTADRKWSCGHPGSRQWTTRREIEFWLSLVSHSFIKLQIITASLAHFCAENRKIRGKVFYVPNSVFDCQNVCWEDDEMNTMRECSSFAVSWQNYSVCVQHFCLYSLRFYWGAKKGYLILHSYWKHLLKGEKKTYFLFLTKLYSTCNSPLHPHSAMVKLQEIFSGKRRRRALRILICQCSKKLAKIMQIIWQTSDEIGMTQLYLGYFLEKLVWSSYFCPPQSGLGSHEPGLPGLIGRPDTFLLKSHLSDEILYSLVKNLSRMLDCWVW